MNRIRKNFMSYKGRNEPSSYQKVKVYKNLHNGLWSIKDVKTGLVLGHTNEVTLYDCEYKVSQKGRERVLKEKQKNIHAYIVGHYLGSNFYPRAYLERSGDLKSYEQLETVTYNPYKESHFTTLESERTKVIERSNHCTMNAEWSLVLSF